MCACLTVVALCFFVVRVFCVGTVPFSGGVFDFVQQCSVVFCAGLVQKKITDERRKQRKASFGTVTDRQATAIRKKPSRNAKIVKNTSKKGVKLFDTSLFFVVKSLRCEKRGLKRKVTETTENLLPTHTKPRVLWPNCCFRRQVASTAKLPSMRNQANENLLY